ncbi:OmpA family protein [Elusimicrobiota bacterium]
MHKNYLLLIVVAALFFGCAKKQVLEPEEELISAEEQAQLEKAKKGEEPSVRFSDWKNVPELETIYFDYDKADLSESARTALQSNADFMKNNPEYIFLVEGHCDERGTIEYNLSLGQRRAISVRDYYGNLGAPLSSIGTISYGEEKPAIMADDESAWSKNRRAETFVRSKESSKSKTK